MRIGGIVILIHEPGPWWLGIRPPASGKVEAPAPAPGSVSEKVIGAHTSHAQADNSKNGGGGTSSGPAKSVRHSSDIWLPIDVAVDVSMDEIARQIQTQLKEQNAEEAGTEVLLALPTSWCLSAAISMAGLPRRSGAREAMLFRLEEMLPLAAEEFTGDFVADTTVAFGVATSTDRVRAIVDALEKTGLIVGAIYPAAMLAVQDALAVAQITTDAVAKSSGGSFKAVPPQNKYVPSGSTQTDTSGNDGTESPSSGSPPIVEHIPVRQIQATTSLVLWMGEDDTADLFVIRNQTPIAWRHLDEITRSSDELDFHLRVLGFEHGVPTRMVIAGGAGALRDTVGASHSELVTQVLPPRAIRDVCLDAAGAAADHTNISTPWIDLRRDALAPSDPYRRLRRPVSVALATAGIFLLILSGAFFWRAYQYSNHADASYREQERVYSDIFPGQSMPAGIHSRLESERRRLRGLSGSASEWAGPSSLTVLRELLARLPVKELRVRILEARFEGDRLYLEGQARSHGDADAVAVAMRKQRGFIVDPPRTESLPSQGVSFVITAQWSGQEPVKGGTP